MTLLRESAWVPIHGLTHDDAESLERLGRNLATGITDEEGTAPPSVIQCRRDTSDVWQVRVNECVGLIGIPTRTWVVAPKIPIDHLLLIMQSGGSLPRHAETPATMAKGTNFFDLVFDWFLSSVERVVRRDLLRGYTPATQRLQYIRGTVDPLTLSRELLRGQIRPLCHFEEFDVNVPLNRILKSALLKGLGTGLLTADGAKRTRRLLARFEGVGAARARDLSAKVDRHSHTYSSAVELGVQILRGIYREFDQGHGKAWCFLWPTAAAVETGLRNMLQDALPAVAVTKTPATHDSLSFNADLVIGRHAVGDVKYSYDIGTWKRENLNQLLAFAVAYQRSMCLLVNFSHEPLLTQQAVVSGVSLTRIAWPASMSAHDAQVRLEQEVTTWWGAELGNATEEASNVDVA